MKLRIDLVLLVITRGMVYNFNFAYFYAIYKANWLSSPLSSIIFTTVVKVSSRLILIKASRSALTGFSGKLYLKILNKSVKSLSYSTFSYNLLISIRIGCLMVGSATKFLAIILKSFPFRFILISLVIIFSSIQLYMSLLRFIN